MDQAQILEQKLMLHTRISILMLALLLLAPTALSDSGTRVFSDQHYGYLLRYPAGWQASIHRSGLVASEVLGPQRSAGLQVRIQELKGAERAFEQVILKKTGIQFEA